MAAQDNSGATPTPTSVIASEFIRAYYNALSNEPSALYAFYEDDSKFSRFEEGQVTDATPAQGQLAIHESVQSIPYAGCKVRIETTDSHDSAFGCVIVIVTGIIVLVGQPPRTFVQTFLLQPVVSGSPHFYVRNDILRYTSKITPPPATTTTPAPTPASSNHLPVPEPQHAPRPASPVATPASAPSSPKKQPIAAPASPQPVAPKSPIKKAEEPVATPEPIVAPKSPQRAPEPAPAAASPTPEEQPAPAAAAAPAEKPQRVRKDRPKREKPAAAAPAPAAAPAAETPAQAAAAPEVKQEQKASTKVAEKPKAVAKPAPVQPPRPTTWASRLFNAAKDGPLGIAKLATGTDVEPLETAPIDTTAHINGENAATAAPTATNTETEQAARKPRSNKRPPSRTGKSGDAPTEKRERDPLYSLWVNNIPPQTTQPELNTLFGQYGNMRPIRLVAGKTYCFVDYYDIPSLENALRARPIKIHGVELSVDKKQMKQTPRPTSATSTASKPTSTSTATPATTEDDDGFQKSTAGRSRAYKQRVASENKAAAAQQQQAQQTGAPRPASGAKKAAPTNGAPRK